MDAEIKDFMKYKTDQQKIEVMARIGDIVRSQIELLLYRGYPSESLLQLVKEVTSDVELKKVAGQ